MGAPLLILNPPELLVIKGPFRRSICKKIELNNPSNQNYIAFKMKTTTPTIFFVRPTVGILKPLEQVTVDILMHPMFQYSERDAESHKFRVQAAVADKNVGLKAFWKNIDEANVWHAKIRVKLEDVQVEDTGADVGKADDEADLKEALREYQEAVAKDDNTGSELLDSEINEPHNVLLVQVNELVKKKEELMQEIEANKALKVKQQKGSSCFFFVFSFIVMVAAVIGGFIAKTYF